MVLHISIPLFAGSYLQSYGGLPADENVGKNSLNDKVMLKSCSMQSKYMSLYSLLKLSL